MRLYFVNRFFHPDHSATSQMLSDIAFALAEQGQMVTVITSRLRYDSNEILPARETVRGVEVVRLATTAFGRGNLWGRSLDYITFYISAFLSLAKRLRRGDVVVAKTDPPLMSVVAAPAAWLRGAKLVNWLQDVFPEVAQAISGSRSWPKSFVFSVLRSVRNASLRAADRNVVIGTRMAELVADQGVARETISVIENWSDGRLVQPVAPSDNPLIRDWGLNGRFVVGYSGNLGRAHEFETFVAAMSELQQIAESDASPAAASRIVWLFIGGGALMDRLKTEVAARGISGVMFKPYQDREVMANSLSVADVHLISLRPELEGLIVPSKYYGICAAGRPTIFVGARDGEVARHLSRSGNGVQIDVGDGAGLARAVLGLASDAAGREKMGAAARAAFERDHDIDQAAGNWRRCIATLRD